MLSVKKKYGKNAMLKGMKSAGGRDRDGAEQPDWRTIRYNGLGTCGRGTQI